MTALCFEKITLVTDDAFTAMNPVEKRDGPIMVLNEDSLEEDRGDFEVEIEVEGMKLGMVIELFGYDVEVLEVTGLAVVEVESEHASLVSFKPESSSLIFPSESQEGQGSNNYGPRSKKIRKGNNEYEESMRKPANEFKEVPESRLPTIVETDEGHEVFMRSQHHRTTLRKDTEPKKQVEFVQRNPQDVVEELQYDRMTQDSIDSPTNKVLKQRDGAATQRENEAQIEASSCCCPCPSPS